MEVSGHLEACGAVLFRGFDVTTADDFEKIGLAVNPDLATRYPGGAPREKLAPHVWTASETPGRMPISSHCELSYIPKLRPNQILFCCLSAADEGGETPVANMHAVWDSLPKDLQSKILENDFQVVRQFPESKRRMFDVRRLAGPTTAWPDVLGSKDPDTVQADAEQDGVSLTFWSGGDEAPFLLWAKQLGKIWSALLYIPVMFGSMLVAFFVTVCPWPLVEMQDKIRKPDPKNLDCCVELVTSFAGCHQVSGARAYAGVKILRIWLTNLILHLDQGPWTDHHKKSNQH